MITIKTSTTTKHFIRTLNMLSIYIKKKIEKQKEFAN